MTFAISLATFAAAVPENSTWKLRTVDASAAQQKVDDLIRFADGADSVLQQFDARLAAANGLLSVVLAPVASRQLLDIPEAGDADEARRILALAGEHLAQADRLLEAAAKEPDAQDARIANRREKLAGVRAFAGVFNAVWPATGDAASDGLIEETPELREAMLNLSIVMEDRHATIAQTARLWRAYLFSRGGETSRALDLLPLSLDPPAGDASVSLFARLLRCKLFVGADDGYAATYAMLARMEERANGWFATPADRAAARRTVALERRRVAQAWGKTFADAGQADRAAWCTSAIERLDKKYFSDAEARDLLPLAWAAPPVVELEIPKGTGDLPDDSDLDDEDISTVGFKGE
ncbi:MAG: hypothetical protein H6817_08805 [Phycisphaerales bacterium]|nr:hypothetical protein [Phycisphaerales bacterium]